MDTIEFRSMNSSIQTEANAAFVQPTQAYTKNGCSGGKPCGGCSNGCGHHENTAETGSGCYDNGRSNGYENDYARSGDKGCGYENDYARSGDKGCGYENNGNRSGDKGCDRSNGYDNGYARYDGNGGHNARNGHIYYNGCEEIKVNEMDDKDIEATGRIMDVTMTLKNVCPCRRVSVGYMVTEMDEENNEHSCGFKCFTVPAHYNSECCDVEVERTRFILPDDARVDGCKGHCNGTRHFIVRAEAHYADSNVTMP